MDTKNNRCFKCNKKLSLGQQGMNCKCGNQYCSLCRYPESHECEFDFREDAKKKLKDQLVKVSGDKLSR